MEDHSHLQVYRRFFGTLLSVVPGVNLVLGIAALVLWIFADLVEIEWGWAVGIAAVVLAICFVAWIFIGLGVQKWAESKSAGLLFGINAPFLLLDIGFMGWLFWDVVINAHGPGTEAASVVVSALSAFA